MIVLIDGIDKAGKSTLAKEIAIQLGCGIEHVGKPQTDNVFEEYKAMLETAGKHPHIVMDRSYLGEQVYGPLWRGKSEINDEQLRALDEIARKHNAVVIHATAPEMVIAERCVKEREELLKGGEIKQCLNDFDAVMAKTKLPKYVYDSSKYTVEDFVRFFLAKTNYLR